MGKHIYKITLWALIKVLILIIAFIIGAISLTIFIVDRLDLINQMYISDICDRMIKSTDSNGVIFEITFAIRCWNLRNAGAYIAIFLLLELIFIVPFYFSKRKSAKRN